MPHRRLGMWRRCAPVEMLVAQLRAGGSLWVALL